MLFILTQDNTIAADFTKLFFKYVEYYFDLSKSIITDRDSYIILKFWWEVYKIKIIK
jgi:hypothetical protein